jgi:hypothetical protein
MCVVVFSSTNCVIGRFCTLWEQRQSYNILSGVRDRDICQSDLSNISSCSHYGCHSGLMENPTATSGC